MARVELNGLRKAFGAQEVLSPIDLVVEEGEFVVLVGPSGCGKSTLLRCIAGLEPASGGEIRIGGRDVTHAEPVERGIAMVFQSYALYPHMTVAENIGFGLRIAKRPKAEIVARVREVAALLQLGHLLDRKPKALSGGQRQRVAIGRALARKPPIFLFDEPLSNLDAGLRAEMRVELARLHGELGNTMIYVTHDQVEAMTLADRIVILNAGHIEQVGSPLDLYNHPACRFVAGFLGQPPMNFLRIGTGDAGHPVPPVPIVDSLAALAEATEVGLRPEHVWIATGSEVAQFEVSIDVIEQFGGETIVHALLNDGQPIVLRLGGQLALGRGERISVAFDPANLHFFGADGKAVR
ncbi:MAG: ABC transporter ATP-binding protein [Ancalomicrobiaceae bacterium]|nr:ABC transporter ATP-binding protein [Ancalomicrobiaceae bacterium]